VKKIFKVTCEEIKIKDLPEKELKLFENLKKEL